MAVGVKRDIDQCPPKEQSAITNWPKIEYLQMGFIQPSVKSVQLFTISFKYYLYELLGNQRLEDSTFLSLYYLYVSELEWGAVTL